MRGGSRSCSRGNALPRRLPRRSGRGHRVVLRRAALGAVRDSARPRPRGSAPATGAVTRAR